MIKGIIGKKIGMSQIFDENGEIVPVTLIQAGPCYVIQKKIQEKDKYDSIQLGFSQKRDFRVNKALKGHQDKAGKGCFYHLKEFSCDDVASVDVGQEIKIEDVFEKGEIIKVTGTSKGKGYAGVMRRHGFGGLPASHGAKIHRSSGSVGTCADPGKIIKGRKMAGHLGNDRVTVKGLKIIDIKPEDNIIAIKGAVPGSKGKIVMLKKQGD